MGPPHHWNYHRVIFLTIAICASWVRWMWEILCLEQESNPNRWVFFLLEVYIRATSKVIWGWVPTCDSSHSWQLHSAVPLDNRAAGAMTQYPTQSHYPDIEQTSPCLILLMLNMCLGSDKYQFDKSLVWVDREPNSWAPTREACTLPIQPPFRYFLSG